jgi:hypothetical protein
MRSGMPGLNLGDNWTPLVRNVVGVLFVVYVAQLLTGGRLEALLAWQPMGDGFRPWQPLSSFLLSGPDPLGAFFEWLGVFFLVGPLERLLGRRSLFGAVGASLAASVPLALLGQWLGVLGVAGGAVLGIEPLLVALVALFGFTMPSAQFLFMFVIPMRAAWLAWGTGLLSFLYLLYSRDVGSALAFFSWGGAWLWTGVRNGALRRAQLQWKRARIAREQRKFQVIEGGRGDDAPNGRRSARREPNDWVN